MNLSVNFKSEGYRLICTHRLFAAGLQGNSIIHYVDSIWIQIQRFVEIAEIVEKFLGLKQGRTEDLSVWSFLLKNLHVLVNWRL